MSHSGSHDGDDGRGRAILHIDADSFFLSVHARATGDASLLTAPCVVWQYNDVFCASQAAKKLGVRKHMTPDAARKLVEPHGGRLIHAYWRQWPGPRIWYGPYNEASRELHAALRDAVADVVGAGAPIERASVDEVYVDVSGAAADLAAAERIAHALRERTRSLGLPLSIGVAPSRLLAKLASNRAKLAADGVFVVHDPAALLAATPAHKLPGLGTKADALRQLGVSSAADLQAHGAEALIRALGLTAAAAEAALTRARGADDTAVKEVVPQSCSVTSWLAHDVFARLAMKGPLGLDIGCGAPLHVGGWCFEPHIERGKSNDTRARWLVLALALDLEERLCHHALCHKQAPTKLTVTWQPPASGSNWGHGGSQSRSVALAPALFGSVNEHSELRRGVPYLETARRADGVISPETLVTRSPHSTPSCSRRPPKNGASTAAASPRSSTRRQRCCTAGRRSCPRTRRLRS